MENSSKKNWISGIGAAAAPFAPWAPLAGALLSSLFGSGKQQFQDPAVLLSQLSAYWEKQLMPGMGARVSSAIGAGNALEQNLSHSLGKSGAFSSGSGRLAKGIGTTFGGIGAGMAEADLRSQIAQLTNSSFGSTVGASRQGPLGRTPGKIENIQALFADLFSSPEALASLAKGFQSQKKTGEST